MFVHVDLLEESPRLLGFVFGASVIRTGTRLELAVVFGEHLLEADVVSFLDLFYVLLQLLELPLVLAGAIAKNEISKILGNETVLFYYFIERCSESIVLSYGTAIVLKQTATYSLDGGLKDLKQAQEESQHLPDLLLKYLETGSSSCSPSSMKGSSRLLRKACSLVTSSWCLE